MRLSHTQTAVLWLTTLAAVGLTTGCAAQRASTARWRISAIDTKRDSKPSTEVADVDEENDELEVVEQELADRPVIPRQKTAASAQPSNTRFHERSPEFEQPEIEQVAAEVDDAEEFLAAAFRKQPAPLAADDYNTPDNTPLDPQVTRSVRFEVPAELPGSQAPPLRVPPFDPEQSLDERKIAIQNLYVPLPALPAASDMALDQPQWTLTELENVAWENHPALQQAGALVEVARGQMIQAGLHPNPTIGYEGDTINTLGTAGYQGPYITQQIVTGGKLKLAQCAAQMEFENAHVAYQRTKIEIATRVRDAYYDVIVAQQRRKMLTALAKFSETIYQAQIELVAGGQAAPYEPLQLRVSAMQARNAVIDADNAAVAAGRRLGAAAGLPDVERFQVAGQAESVPAEIDYESAKIYLLENHTELRTVRNQVVQAQYRSRLEYIRPRIPDLNLYSTVQKDYTGPPYATTFNVQVGAPIPVFDRNQGNILATQSSILGHEREHGSVQNRLTGELAAILARYDTARTLAVNYRDQILPDQVRTYRGVYSRYREGGQAANDNISFGDVIVAEQTLGTAVNDYATVLTNLWQAYVDAAELLQVEDLQVLDAWFGVPN